MRTNLLAIAFAQYGLKEAAGDGDNAIILKMAADCGFADYKHDSIAWCSLFANWVCLKAGYERSKKLNARSWLDIGEATDNPEIGDIVVLWRDKPDGWEGHVGFYINQDTGLYINGNGNFVYILAGNQSDMVNISSFAKGKILGFRQLNLAV